MYTSSAFTRVFRAVSVIVFIWSVFAGLIIPGIFIFFLFSLSGLIFLAFAMVVAEIADGIRANHQLLLDIKKATNAESPLAISHSTDKPSLSDIAVATPAGWVCTTCDEMNPAAQFMCRECGKRR